MYETAMVTDQNRLIVERHHNRINETHQGLAGGIIEVINKNNAAKENKEKKPTNKEIRHSEEMVESGRKHRMIHRIWSWLSGGGSCNLLKWILGKWQMHLRSS